MSVTTDFLTGIAARLAAAALGLTYNESGVYTTGQTGIFMKMMPATPDRVVVLNLVNQGDDISMPLGKIMLQVRGRGLANKPLDVDALLDPIFDNLHGLTGLTLGTAGIIQLNRQVSTPMGMDESKRWERVDQYYSDVDFPATTNRPVQGSW